jgi:hypothetical protein
LDRREKLGTIFFKFLGAGVVWPEDRPETRAKAHIFSLPAVTRTKFPRVGVPFYFETGMSRRRYAAGDRAASRCYKEVAAIARKD